MPGRADFLVELRGFELMAIAVQAPARLTRAVLPVVQHFLPEARL